MVFKRLVSMYCSEIAHLHLNADANTLISWWIAASFSALIVVATMPAQQLYWQTTLPAYCPMAFSLDFIFTASQIVASNSVPKSQQEVAASLIGTL
jgi:hypothetical protein